MNTTPLSSSREAVAGIADEAPERMVDNPDEEREGIESQMSTGKGEFGRSRQPGVWARRIGTGGVDHSEQDAEGHSK